MKSIRPDHPVVVETNHRMNQFSHEAANRRLVKQARVTRRSLPVWQGLVHLVAILLMVTRLRARPTETPVAKPNLRRRPAHR